MAQLFPSGSLAHRRIAAVLLGLTLVAGCGSKSSSGSPTPTSPTEPSNTAPTNHAPALTALNFDPTFGIAQLTTFAFNASASDPDGDAVSYAWDVAGTPFSGSSGSITFTNGFSGTARVTLTDSKGATATDTRSFVVGSMSGNWTGTIPGYANLRFTLTQNGSVVTGTFFDQFFGEGKVDPAQPGRIDANGNLEMRVKLFVFTDFTFKGRMDPTGRHIAGGVYGSGFTGQPFTMQKQ